MCQHSSHGAEERVLVLAGLYGYGDCRAFTNQFSTSRSGRALTATDPAVKRPSASQWSSIRYGSRH